MQELREYFQEKMYGRWRTGEKVTYELVEDVLKVKVELGDRKTSFDVRVTVPKKENREKFGQKAPFLICMHPIMPSDYVLEQGYTLFTMDVYKIASDDIKHNGCFYDIYPYGEKPEEQTGALMAWGWGVSKILDAIYGGLAQELALDPDASLVTGVSRFGKAVAVCGAFEERIRFVIPACSGAGGLALYGVKSTGNTYDLTEIGGPSDYTYGQNEPLSCLQSDAERGWFCDKFLDFQTEEEIPVGQEMLPIMAMSPERYYCIIAAYMSEDWVNAPAMWECYKLADKEYEVNQLSDHLVASFHREGHAVLQEDLEKILPYFNRMYYKMDVSVDMDRMKTSVFAK